MESFLRDLKYGTKLLIKDKGFTVTAVLTLGLSIGANTAVFTVVDSVLLRPLPYPHGERLVLMFNSYPNAGAERASTSVPDYYDRLREVDVFEEQALYNFRSRTIGYQGTPERIRGMQVTPSLFRVLEIEPRLGRTFTEEEGEPGNAERVVLSHALWQQLYGGDPEALGREIRIDGVVHTVVGVMPEDFLFLEEGIRLWTPLAFTPEQKSDQARHSNNWTMIGRLKPGATVDQAQAQIDALNAANLDRFPMFKEVLINAGFHSLAVPLHDDLVREIAPRLYLLWGAVCLVLLIGCVNIANLVLVRSSGRLKEFATRAALGAGQWRVIRQLMTESVLLTIGGGALGLLFGHLGLVALSRLAIDQIPRGAEIAMQGHVVVATLGLAALIGLVFGLIPVVSVARINRINMSAILHQEGRTGSSGRGARMVRKVLVVAQVTLAFVLLIGAGLLLASFREILAIDPGFDPQQVLTASVNLPAARYQDDDAMRSFTARATAAIRSLPGVVAAGATSSIPFGESYSDSVILAEGYAMEPGESLISPNRLIVTPGYLESLEIPLLSGRLFDSRDTADSPPVVIVDERLARKFWPGVDPLGRRMFTPNNPDDLLTPAPDTDFLTVVGVVGEIKLEGLLQDDSVGAYYFPNAQRSRGFLTFAIKTVGDPGALIGSVRREIAALDPELALFDIRTMEERMSESLLTRRTPLLLVMIFGALALGLSAVGLYGVMAYSVTLRTRELGIRIALGSTGQRVFRLVLNEGLLILGIGVVLGLISAVLFRNALASQLYGVEPLEPNVLVLVSAVLGLSSLAACLIPALRATRIDPVRALISE